MAEAFDPVQTVAAILTEHGPLHSDDFARHLRDSGVAEPDANIDEINWPVAQLADGRWVWLPTLLAGRVFTHRISADEMARDVLAVTPDLAPIVSLCEHEEYGRFTDGSPARVAMPDYDDELLDERGIADELADPVGALLLAPGTLAALGVAEGDLVGVRITDRGLVAERVTTLADGVAGERLAATVAAAEPLDVAAAVWTTCVEHPTVFTEPLAPIGEIVDEIGLAYDGINLATAEFDFDSWHFDVGCEALAARHELDREDAVPLYTLVKLYEQVSAIMEAIAGADDGLEDVSTEALGDTPELEDREFADLVAEAGAALADPLVAELLLTETLDNDPRGAAVLGLFAEILEPKVPRAARVACRWLHAVALERIGDIAAAERELLAAESMDPDWPLVLMALARFASDRGDAEHGLALLRRADADPDNPLVELLERYRAQPRSDLGRNEPCWCGSGRKYKKCHLGREQLPLAARVGWLYKKACHHALLDGWDALVEEVAWERCRHGLADDPDALDEAMGDPLVLDTVLFEGGAFAEFLEVRGSLLPDDERRLAEQWAATDRSVFKVEEVERGQGVTVRDLRTGETHELRERTASHRLQPGQLVCARVVPAGDSMQFLGGVEPVAAQERDALVELLDTRPDPVELVALLSRRLARSN
ncbi:zinc-binding protein [Mycobacterium alsense]|uniref:SEC-C domain-containing protein n=1 Tax=Mycobacterium alsense TaxID=324058 RepID=A0AA41XMH6_9MYCO|nr:SEC-C metal-binding domain-containing protein [Mycobacterium alsense]MCV7378741.1 SEC-C domain-containing protein [Mycobacterium alsense]OQZ93826.1 zinc-binding protein [Mycobacterium alsense]